jgi:signal transduction histidine kinase
MSLLARQMGREVSSSKLRGLLSIMLAGWAAGIPVPEGADALSERPLAYVGAAGLIALPLLLAVSSFLQSPLAAPAVIALGYLAAAHAHRAHQRRRAATWTLAVHAGLVAWTVMYVVAAGGQLSAAGIAALALAPAFAAAPALVSRMLALRSSEQGDAASRVGVPEDAGFRGDRGDSVTDDGLIGNGTVAVHAAHQLKSDLSTSSEADEGSDAQPTEAAERQEALGCDVGDAIAFATRRIVRIINAKNICLLVDPAEDIQAACELRLCRQIAALLLCAAVEASGTGADIHVHARGLRGAVLLRVTCEDDDPGPAMMQRLREVLAATAMHDLVAAAGGTIVSALAGHGASVSIRLASPRSSSAQCAPAVAGVA